MKVVMNRCPKIEYGRLSSEIAWMGVNTRIISKKATATGGVQRLSLNRTSVSGGTTEPRPRPNRPSANAAAQRRRGTMASSLIACQTTQKALLVRIELLDRGTRNGG